MIMDNELVFSDQQSVVTAVDSTNYVDLGAASQDIGTGEDLYLVVRVTTAFTDASNNSTVAVTLEGDSTTTFSPDASELLFTIPALAAVGDTFVKKLSPGSAPLQYRYIQLSYATANGDLDTGKVSAFITKDIDKVRYHASGFSIS